MNAPFIVTHAPCTRCHEETWVAAIPPALPGPPARLCRECLLGALAACFRPGPTGRPGSVRACGGNEMRTPYRGEKRTLWSWRLEKQKPEEEEWTCHAEGTDLPGIAGASTWTRGCDRAYLGYSVFPTREEAIFAKIAHFARIRDEFQERIDRALGLLSEPEPISQENKAPTSP